MSPREVFGLAVRLAGLYVTYNSVITLGGLAMAALSPMFKFTPSGAMGSVSGLFGGAFAGMALFAILQAVAGLWLLRGAPRLVAYAYGEEPGASPARAGSTAHGARA